MAGHGVMLPALIKTGIGYVRMSSLMAYSKTNGAWAHALGYQPNRPIGGTTVEDFASQVAQRIETNRGIIEVHPASRIWMAITDDPVHRFTQTPVTLAVADEIWITYQSQMSELDVDIDTPLPPTSIVPISSSLTIPSMDNDLCWFFGYISTGALFYYNDLTADPIVSESRMRLPAGDLETRVQAQLDKFDGGTLTRIDADYVKLSIPDFFYYWMQAWVRSNEGGDIPNILLSRGNTKQRYFLAGVWDYATTINGGDASFLCTTTNRRRATDLCALLSSAGIVGLLSKNSVAPFPYEIKHDPDYYYWNYNILDPYSSLTRTAPGATADPASLLPAVVQSISTPQPSRTIGLVLPGKIPFVANGFAISPP